MIYLVLGYDSLDELIVMTQTHFSSKRLAQEYAEMCALDFHAFVVKMAF